MKTLMSRKSAIKADQNENEAAAEEKTKFNLKLIRPRTLYERHTSSLFTSVANHHHRK